MATATVPVSVEEISRELDEKTAARTKVTDELEKATAALAAFDGEKRALLVEAADGDSSAKGRLDTLDRAKVELQRQADGLKLKIESLDPSIAELRQKQGALLEQAAERKRKEMAAALLAEALLHARNQVACWRRGCRESFLVSETLARAQASGITERQYSQILQQVTELFDREKPARVNEKWKNRSSSLGSPLMTIMPECPPDSARDREELLR